MTDDQLGFGFSDDMFEFGNAIPFHKFKNGEHKFRVLPPFAPKKLFHKVSIHWGFRDENNRIKALQCSKDHENRCPICDEVEKMERMKSAYETAGKISEMKAIEKQIGDIRRKPTYLWNILTDAGEQKVLTLSWNGHDPLLNEVKFMWEKQKVNVTDPKACLLMWCQRTGEKAKTRYVYKALQNTATAVSVDKLFDLTKVYKIFKYDELKKIIDDGAVMGGSEKEHEKADFVADIPPAQQQAASPVQQPAPAVTAPAAASTTPVAAPTQPAQPTPQVQMNSSQEAEIQNMLKILNGQKS